MPLVNVLCFLVLWTPDWPANKNKQRTCSHGNHHIPTHSTILLNDRDSTVESRSLQIDNSTIASTVQHTVYVVYILRSSQCHITMVSSWHCWLQPAASWGSEGPSSESTSSFCVWEGNRISIVHRIAGNFRGIKSCYFRGQTDLDENVTHENIITPQKSLSNLYPTKITLYTIDKWIHKQA